jgi:hypothetical protein
MWVYISIFIFVTSISIISALSAAAALARCPECVCIYPLFFLLLVSIIHWNCRLRPHWPGVTNVGVR